MDNLIQQLLDSIERASKIDKVWTEKQIVAGIHMFNSTKVESNVSMRYSDEYSQKNWNWAYIPNL